MSQTELIRAWQICPVCTGAGVLNRPPGTPAGQNFVSSSTGPWPCKRCGGTGTLSTPPIPSAAEALPEWVKYQIKVYRTSQRPSTLVEAFLYIADALERAQLSPAVLAEIRRLIRENDRLRAQLAQAQRERDEERQARAMVEDDTLMLADGVLERDAQLAAQAPVLAAAREWTKVIRDPTALRGRSKKLLQAVRAYEATLSPASPPQEENT